MQLIVSTGTDSETHKRPATMCQTLEAGNCITHCVPVEQESKVNLLVLAASHAFHCRTDQHLIIQRAKCCCATHNF